MENQPPYGQTPRQPAAPTPSPSALHANDVHQTVHPPYRPVVNPVVPSVDQVMSATGAAGPSWYTRPNPPAGSDYKFRSQHRRHLRIGMLTIAAIVATLAVGAWAGFNYYKGKDVASITQAPALTKVRPAATVPSTAIFTPANEQTTEQQGDDSAVTSIQANQSIAAGDSALADATAALNYKQADL